MTISIKPTKYYAMVTATGTACPETTLREDEYDARNRLRVERLARQQTGFGDPPVAGSWVEVTDNEVCIDYREGN